MLECVKQNESLSGFFKGAAIINAIERIPDKVWGLSDKELAKEAKPTKVDYALKNSVWHLVRVASGRATKVAMKDIYIGICGYPHFYYRVLSNPFKLCWILRLDSGNKVLERELLDCVLDSLRTVLTVRLVNEEEKVDLNAVKAVVNIGEFLIAQLVDTKSAS